MKVISIICISILSNLFVYGQDSSGFFRNELSISLNHNYNSDKKNPTGTGFGAGFYFRLFAEHKLNLVTGTELNMVHFYAKYVEHSHFTDFHDVTFNLFSNTLPITLRFNLGNKIRLITEAGWYFEILPLATAKGTYSYSIPDNGVPTHWDSGEKTEKKTYFAINFDNGYRAGLGIQFSGPEYDIIFKIDYTHGFHEIILPENQYHIEYYRFSAIVGF